LRGETDVYEAGQFRLAPEPTEHIARRPIMLRQELLMVRYPILLGHQGFHVLLHRIQTLQKTINVSGHGTRATGHAYLTLGY
jgi:hypothetical protein